MALPPTIPTSFVPHPSSASQKRFKVDFVGAFGLLSMVIFVLMIVLAVVVFLYKGALTVAKENKTAELIEKQKSIDPAVAQSFVRLSNRLTSGQMLLDNHIAFSGFYSTLGDILPNTVRFSSLHVAATEGKKMTLDGAGVAKNFNALAAASSEFAKNGGIKDAIFSKVLVNKDNSVSFSLTATIDPELVEFRAADLAAAPAPAAATTSATTTL
jgi:hypothetical protein